MHARASKNWNQATQWGMILLWWIVPMVSVTSPVPGQVDGPLRDALTDNADPIRPLGTPIRPSGTKPSGTNPSDRTRAGTVIESVGPDILYVPDENGGLVPVPAGITIEDFQRLYQIQQGLTEPATPPKYVVEESSISGSVESGQGKFTVVLTLRVMAEGPIRVPLGLVNGIPLEIPSSTDDLSIAIRFDEDAGGYVAWFEAEKDSKHRVQLRFLVPIQRVANQSTLNLETPRATLSRFELEVPERSPTVAHSENAQLQSVASLDSGRSKISLVGGAGILRLSWSETSQGSTTSASSSLDVDSTLFVSFGGPDAMRTEATFRVQSFGQPVDTVRIRLPDHSKVVSTSGSPYEVTIEPIGDSDLQVAVFRLPGPTRNRFTLKLLVEQRLENNGETNPDQRLSAGGFFVEGAFRHLGHLALAIEGDWLPRWEESSTVLPTAEIPAELQSEGPATVFRFYQQHFELPLTIVRKLTRISVAPTFVFDVQPDRIELRALLKVTVHGAPAQGLAVEFPGWDVYDIADTVAINEDELVLQVQPLRIPFSQPQRDRFDLEVLARRKIPAGTSSLKLELPRVLNASSAQPIVVAQPAENVNLNLQPGESAKLVPSRVPFDVSPTTAEQSVLCHRLVDGSEKPAIVYDFQLKPLLVQANVTSKVDIRQDVANVEQQMVLDVRNATLDRIVLRVPVPDPDGWSIDDLEFAIGGSVLSATRDDELATALAANVEASGSEADFRFPVYDLPFGAIGFINATVRYSVTPQTVQDGWQIPLTLPEVNRIGNHEVVVRSPENTSVRIGDTRWSSANDGRRREKTNVIVATAEGGVDALEVEVNTVSDDDVSSTIVQRAFIQTWSTNTSRRDLAIFRFDSDEDTLAIKLPNEASEIRAAIDREPIALTRRSKLIFEANLEEFPQGEHVLELSYLFTKPLEGFQSQIELPQFVDANWTQEFFWQLVLPKRTHLVREPTKLISANHWGWRGISWGRTPQHEQEWFEQWIGSSPQPFSPPTDSTNRYLFTTFASVEQLNITTASRKLIAAVLIGGAFAIGFVFVSVEWMRRPFSVLVLACVVILAGMAVPASVLAIAPPVFFGVCLVGLVPLLRRFVTSRSAKFGTPGVRRPPSTSIRSTSLREAKLNVGTGATTAKLQVPQDV